MIAENHNTQFKDSGTIPVDEPLTLPEKRLIDSKGNPLKSEATIKAEVANSPEGKMAAELQKNPRFRKMRRQFEKALGNLERSQPNMAPGDRMQLAAKIALLK
jgi:hypothetical protein